MQLKWYHAAIVVITILATLLFWSFHKAQPQALPGDYRSFSRVGSQGFATPAELERMLNRNPSHRAMLEAYRVHAQYPDFSRPLDKTMVDLIDPWKHIDEPLPLVGDPALRTEGGVKKRIEELKKSGKSDAEIEADLKKYYDTQPKYQFAANRHTLTFGDELIVTLRVTDTNGAKLPYTLGDVFILGDPLFTKSQLGSPDFNDNGISPDQTADDGVTTFSWKIPGEDKKYWGNLKLIVQIKPKGAKEPIEVSHTFFASPISPAKFTDNFSERLENGSLVIDAVIDVKRECKFVFQANLYDYRGNPTHWVTVNQVFEPGFRTVSFVFFGKIFRDNGYSGKFTIRDLRGTCENLPFPARWIGDPAKADAIANANPLEEPVLYYMPYTTKTYTTLREYALKDFSNAEWSSPEKDARLREMGEAARGEN
ncbi:MAG: hypothetical protein J0L53_19680 [Spirochaetes bacterium]|nr:hypothetical protein [Spirochaetota bacterium]